MAINDIEPIIIFLRPTFCTIKIADPKITKVKAVCNDQLISGVFE